MLIEFVKFSSDVTNYDLQEKERFGTSNSLNDDIKLHSHGSKYLSTCSKYLTKNF